MNRYPRLAEMGVVHPEHIERFSVSSIDYVDALRITYIRPKGSLLPVSRAYKFPRIQKSVAGKGGKDEVVMASDPALGEALDELRAIIGARQGADGIAAAIVEELSLLEHDIAMRSAYIKELADKLQSGD